MNKAPAFQFYVADYIQDTRCLSLAAKGAWTDCLCAMWRSLTKGEITYPIIGYARLFGCTVDQAKAVIDELVEMQICDSVTHGDGKVTLINRRMQREAKDREQANKRQNKYRNRLKQQRDETSDGESDEYVASYSSSSSSFANTNGSGSSSNSARGKPPPAAAENISPKRQWEDLTPEEKAMSKKDFAEHLSKEFPDQNVRAVSRKLKKWCEENGKDFVRERLKGWLVGEGQTLDDEFLSALGDEPDKTRIDEDEFFKKKYGAANAEKAEMK